MDVHRLSLLAALTLLVGCSKPASTHLEVERQRIAISRQWRDIVTTTSSRQEMCETADAVNGLSARLEKLAEQKNKLPTPPSADEQAKIEKLRAEDEVALGRAILSHVKRIGGGAQADAEAQARYRQAEIRFAKANKALGVQRLIPGEDEDLRP